MWFCQCDCGVSKAILAEVLRRGDTRSCGCLRRHGNRRVHGQNHSHRKTREYAAWANAKERCTNPKTRNYHRYGGRGIYMCDRWLNNPSAFLADMGPCPPGLSLDRINNNGPYAPENCRWADRLTQSRNK